MFSQILWVIIRSVAIPYIAYLFLRDMDFLGEDGAVLAIAIALTIANALAVVWNLVRVLGNTLMLKGQKVIALIISIVIQVGSILFAWGYYISEFTDFLA